LIFLIFVFIKMKTLLIVESPAKSKTIEKLLGPNYIVLASYGHIRDLDSKDMGIDIENGFLPQYIDLEKSGNHIKNLKKMVSKVQRVLLASDEDREGEAIAWHCLVRLGLNIEDRNRICFHEITKEALTRAVENPRRINMDMVNSQQARRVLDRLIGYELSPILMRRFGSNQSAGRVQSVCLKVINDKEDEVSSFEDRKYYRTIGEFEKGIEGVLNENIESEEEVERFLECIQNGEIIYKIENMEIKRLEKRPPPPYTTSSIQQDIGSRFGIPSKAIMGILQNLYEQGKITYHRTDSTNLSEHIMKEIRKYIQEDEELGREYYHPRLYKTKSKSAQEAHEAIRPTHISTIELEDTFDENSKRIYQMIWRRTVASQMTSYVYDLYELRIGIYGDESIEKYKFISKKEKKIFDGYRKIYREVKKEDEEEITKMENEEDERIFGNIEIGEIVVNQRICITEKRQNPPLRYSEATIIKKMEVIGIGRPSTYASILDRLFSRNYIEKRNIPSRKINGKEYEYKNNQLKKKTIKISIGGENQKLIPTESGKMAIGFLREHFGDIMNETFTSEMESKLDRIVEGNEIWNGVIGEYYELFHPIVFRLKESMGTTNIQSKINKRELGEYEGKHVYVYQSKKGPVYQWGIDKDKEKKWISLPSDKNINEVTIEDFIEEYRKKNEYPKKIWEYNGNDIILKKGPYGFYISYQNRNYKIKSEYDVDELGEDAIRDCLGLNDELNHSDISFPIQKGKYSIKNGPYGVYVQLDKIMASIPKDYDIQSITEEDCKKWILEKKKYQSSKKKK
jgi:DNA topoisomerase-1